MRTSEAQDVQRQIRALEAQTREMKNLIRILITLNNNLVEISRHMPKEEEETN